MKYGLSFVALMTFAAVAFGAQAAEPEQVNYEDFLQKVEAGQVKSVTLEPFFLEGIYSKGDAEIKFFCYYPSNAVGDPLLAKLLEEKQVTVTKPEPRNFDNSQILRIAPGLLLLVIPSALLVFVIIYVVRINKKIDQAIIR